MVVSVELACWLKKGLVRTPREQHHEMDIYFVFDPMRARRSIYTNNAIIDRLLLSFFDVVVWKKSIRVLELESDRYST
jgi:hypothetical protein